MKRFSLHGVWIREGADPREEAPATTEKYVEELAAVRQTLQTDLETSIRRIADLQAALEEVASSDSDTER
ncbi:Unconventional myosin-XVIIIb [Galemys pyrenaicus]|uniref:Unconventional myosin-XVIIIb n=1 Tax=Galemys pyrenaicus TaxID=202257 RepID=A0A8J6A4F5_GALPY|nr:Unconventional myosin-XVIIIb [Galemys pyrenaicus]